jgi:hypothetical protein
LQAVNCRFQGQSTQQWNEVSQQRLDAHNDQLAQQSAQEQSPAMAMRR